MKCKNCGGQYKTKELMCPYCHTENLLGKIWMVQRSEAEEAYEREKKELGKTMLSPYMINRYLNRAMVVSILLFTSIFVGMILIALGYSGIRELRLFINKDEIEATMAEYYEANEWEKLDAYMSDEEVDYSKYPVYTQATNVLFYYNRYLENRLSFESLTDEEKREKELYLGSALRYSIDTYKAKFGLYSEVYAENKAVYEECKKEILAWWIGELQMTKEEIESIENANYVYYSDIDALEEKIRERRGW